MVAVIAPTTSIPELSTSSLLVPPVVTDTVSAAPKYIPVLVSPVLVIDGAELLPSANDATPVIVGPERETTVAVALIPDVRAVPVPNSV